MDDRLHLSTRQGRWVIIAMALGSGMIFLDSTVVNVALPRMQSDLTAPLAGLQWIVNAYTLMLAALVLIGGSIGDVYGRKIAFIAGLMVFSVASVLCGLAPNLEVLIAARALQGLGGALLVPGSLAMIKAVIAPEDSGRAIGLWAGLSGVTTAIGPLLGGYLVGAASWRWIFFINVPLAVATLLITVRCVPANRDAEAHGDLDWPAALATIAGLGGLTYALIEGPQLGWGNGRVLISMAVGLAGILLLPWREARARHPMVPLSTFRSRTFTGANLATLGVYFSFGGALLFLVLDLQQVEGYSPLQAGAALLPITILLLLLSPRIGGLVDKFGARWMLTLGPVLISVSLASLLLLGRHVTYWTNVFPAVVVLGFGMALFVTPLTTTVMSAVPEHLAGVASGISNTLTRVASLLAIAILGLVIVTRFGDALASRLGTLHLPAAARASLVAHADRLADDPIPAHLSRLQHAEVHGAIADAYLDGFHWAMALCALLCLASGGVAAATVRDRRMLSAPTVKTLPATP